MYRRRRLSTGVRVALMVTLVLAVGVNALSAISYFSISGQLRSELDRSLLREAEAFSASVGRSGVEEADGGLHAVARAYLQARSASYSPSRPLLLVRLENGDILSNSDIHLDKAAGNLAALDPKRAKRAFLDVSYAGNRYRAATVPVIDKSHAVIAVFEAALPVAPTAAIINRLVWTLAGAGGLVMLIGAGLSAWAARASLSPLRHAAATADRVSHAHLTERIEYEGPDDVGRLVAAVNAMLDRLESAFGDQRRFLADASHELRTPIAVVGGHLEILRRDDISPAERAEELDLVADEVQRMGRLVDDMISLSRLEAGQQRPFQPLDVRVLLLETAGRGRVLGRNHRFAVMAAQGLWVLGDPDQLLQAMLNLVSNAAAHSPGGSLVRLTAVAEGSNVVIKVDDSGTGIRSEDLPRLFDRFYRSGGPRGAGGGSGLGLAIVRRLLEIHGGTVSAANRPAGGAVFTVTLPMAATPKSA